MSYHIGHNRFSDIMRHNLIKIRDIPIDGVRIYLADKKIIYVSLINKLEHINLVKHLRYLECTDNIKGSLNLDPNTDHNKVIVVIPFFKKNVLFDLAQVVLFLYMSLFTNYVFFTNIETNDIYVEYTPKKTKIIYTFCDRSFQISTNYVVKLDVTLKSHKFLHLNGSHYRTLYQNIINIIPDRHNDIREFITSFVSHDDDTRIVDPIKIVDSILCRIR